MAGGGIVIGSGIVGLTSAIRLAQAGRGVQIWARELPPNTTSNVAAALWYPYRAGPAERVEEWSRRSYTIFCEEAEEPSSGVRLVPGLELFPTPQDAPALIRELPGFRRAAEDELIDGFARGYVFAAPVVEMPVYLECLLERVRGLGIEILRRDLSSLDEPLARADWVVNCSGLGARELAADADVFPIRGQLVRTERGGIDRFLLNEYGDEGITYIVPRSEDCILGGTADERSDDLSPDEATSGAIRARCGRLDPRIAEARTLGVSVGLRPGRPEVRLELDASAGVPLVHNYGHGGAGVTLSWGCADEVVELVDSAL